MTPAYALAIDLPHPLAAATDNAAVQAACEMATAALQRLVARLANGTADQPASAT